MAKFILTREVTGYSRGYQTVEVEAETLEEALAEADKQGSCAEIEIVRDDRDRGDWYAS